MTFADVRSGVSEAIFKLDRINKAVRQPLFHTMSRDTNGPCWVTNDEKISEQQRADELEHL